MGAEADTATAAATRCRNCDFRFSNSGGAYCSNCGQATALHPPTFWEFVHEFIGHYVAFEGKLWRTLVKLFFMPGELTREFLRGRKQRYVLPLRLYLTASFLFFVLVKVLGGDTALVVVAVNDKPMVPVVTFKKFERAISAPTSTGDDANSAESANRVLSGARRAIEAREQGKSAFAKDIIRCDVASSACEPVNQRIKARFGNQTIAEAAHDVKARIEAATPYAIFLMLPIFAALMQLVYRGRKMYYGEHLVFALHLHAFLFFLLLASAALPQVVGFFLFIAAIAYVGVAMQRVYHGRWWATLLRYFAVGTSYLCLVAVVIMTVLVGAVFI